MKLAYFSCDILDSGELMNIQHFLYRHFSNKPVIVIIHGYSRFRWHPLDNLINYFNQNGYVVIVPALFDPTDDHDNDAKLWLERAKLAVEEAYTIKDEVVVIGFSMGGVIASYLSTMFPLSLLVLLAPAFEYITLKRVREHLSKRVLKKSIPEEQEPLYPPLPDHFVDTFKEVVAICKNTVKFILCPLVLFHGTEDESIPLRSSQIAYEMAMTDNRKFYKLKDVGHSIMEDQMYYKDVISIIEQNIKKIP